MSIAMIGGWEVDTDTREIRETPDARLTEEAIRRLVEGMTSEQLRRAAELTEMFRPVVVHPIT